MRLRPAAPSDLALLRYWDTKSHVIVAGGKLRSTQELLGHAPLSTTQRYTEVDADKLMAVYEQAHPRAKG